MGRHTARCATKQSQARISGLYAVLARGSTARRKRETASQCCDRLLRDLGIDKKMSKEELIQFEGLVIEILPDARYRVQLDAGYEVLAYTVPLLRWEPARLASKQPFPVDFRDRIQHERKPGGPRDCDIRLRHTRRAVHGQAPGRGTTTAKLSPLCDRSGGDP